MKLDGKHVLVVGLGASGLAAAELLVQHGARVTLNDARGLDELGARAVEASRLGAGLALGGHDEALFTSVDHIVVSPGVPPLPALDAAERAGVPIASEIELASWFIDGLVVGVTGTNGKSTVTTMLGDMCARTGRPTFVGGNLGQPLTRAAGTAAAREGGIVVVELSSFQLERVDRLRVSVAVYLNLTDDHLDRYDGLASYGAAKARIFHGQRRGDAAIVPAGDARIRAMADVGLATVHSFGAPGGVVRERDGVLVDEVSGLAIPVTELGVCGGHNVENACAAALAARCAGVPREEIEQVLRHFTGLPHRMQPVATVDGVEYVDDSKATNVGATVAALDGLDAGRRVVLVLGGKDKGGSYAPLASRVAARARAVVLIGEAREKIADALRDTGVPLLDAGDLDSVVRVAHAHAAPGDVVLLAPACSSFDMFRSYAHRGEMFREAVLAFARKESR